MNGSPLPFSIISTKGLLCLFEKQKSCIEFDVRKAAVFRRLLLSQYDYGACSIQVAGKLEDHWKGTKAFNPLLAHVCPSCIHS